LAFEFKIFAHSNPLPKSSSFLARPAFFRVTVYANSDAISSELVPAIIGKAEAALNAWNMLITEELVQIKKRIEGVGALSSPSVLHFC
jgi:hypothetical protein